MSAFLKLADQCEKATAPSRALDGNIDRLFNKRPKTGDCDADENCLWRVDNASGLCTRGDGFARNSFCARDYSSSIDAAMTLVPEGWLPLLDATDATEGRNYAELFDATDAPIPKACASSLALALCAAALRARAAIATEAHRAETPKSGSVHEGAGPKDIAQDIGGPSQ